MVPDQWLPLVVSVGNATVLFLIASFLLTIFGFLIFGDAFNQSLFVSLSNKSSKVHKRIVLVCIYYGLTLFIMMLTSRWACNSCTFQSFVKKHNYLYPLSTTIAVFLSMLFINNFSYKDNYFSKLFFFMMHSFLTAPAVCSLEREVCLKSVSYTAKLLAIILIVALTAHENFYEKIVGIFTKINGIVTAASICTSIIGTPRNNFEIFLLCTNIHLGFVFFAWILVINIQMFIGDSFKKEEFDPVYVAAVLHVSTLNLFLRVGTLLTLRRALEHFTKSGVLAKLY